MNSFDLLTAKYNDTKNLVYDYAILPWGATEPHNYHLPYLADCYLSHDIAVDAVIAAYERKGIHGMVLPFIPFGSQNPGQVELPFCLHATYETQKAILMDIVNSLSRQGITKLIIINGHGGNSFKNMIRDLAVDHPYFLIASSNWFGIIPQKDYFDNHDDHAGEMETSVLMHYRPELVDMSVAGDGIYTPFKAQTLRDGVGWMPRNWSKVSKDTGIGCPHKSTAEKGEKYAAAVTAKLATFFIELVTEDLY